MYWLSKYLYEDISRFITGIGMPLFYNDSLIKLYMPALDNIHIFNKRIDFINNLCNKDIFMVRGDLSFCCKEIEQISLG